MRIQYISLKFALAGISLMLVSLILYANPAYAPCMEELGTNCNNYPPQTLTQIKSDMINYMISDKPVITIVGTPHTSVHLEVDDSSSNIVSEHDLNISSYGNASYALDISSYKPDVYSVTATSAMSKISTSFSIGLVPSGPRMMLSTARYVYFPGDTVAILGAYHPNTIYEISLVDPRGTVEKSTQIISDYTGHFSSSDIQVPVGAIPGIWKVSATSGVAHTNVQIKVVSSITTGPASDVSIYNIQIQPSIVKVGDKFTVTATLVNNSTVPIILESGTCSIKDIQVPFFTVAFDNHAKIKEKNMNCAGVGLGQILNPGKIITGTSPDSGSTFTYIATESGTANVTVSFSYHVINQTDPAQPSFSQKISRSFLFTIADSSTSSVKLEKTLLSPLQQSRYGTSAQDVTCKEGLQLVIKSADKSPACLQPDDAYQLIYRGWAKEFVQSILNNSQLVACEGTKVPDGNHRTNNFPVLIMPVDSTATVCVTYNFEHGWDSYRNKDVYPHGILETCCFIHMQNSASSEFSNQFQVVADPPLFNVTGVTDGSKVTVMYKIHAGPNSKGFYDTSVPFDHCDSYPLAVGYDSSDVDATKFHPKIDIPCFNTIDTVDSVNIVTGMTYKEVQFP